MNNIFFKKISLRMIGNYIDCEVSDFLRNQLPYYK